MTTPTKNLSLHGRIALTLLPGLLSNPVLAESVVGEAECDEGVRAALVTEAFVLADLVIKADTEGVGAIKHTHKEEAQGVDPALDSITDLIAKIEAIPGMSIIASIERRASEMGDVKNAQGQTFGEFMANVLAQAKAKAKAQG